jgi:hypothetical protein
LLAAFVGVLKSSTPVELDVVEAFKLESMGLVNLQGNLAMVSCDLFRQYLAIDSVAVDTIFYERLLFAIAPSRIQ